MNCKAQRVELIGQYLELVMRQGTDFEIAIELFEDTPLEPPFDSTGYTARAHMTNDLKTRIEISATFAANVLTLSLAAAVTAQLRAGELHDTSGSYEWDCEFLQGSKVIPAFYGPVTVVKDI
ncbi:MAG: hypothetical protein ACK506_16145 [Pirellula sp.]